MLQVVIDRLLVVAGAQVERVWEWGKACWNLGMGDGLWIVGFGVWDLGGWVGNLAGLEEGVRHELEGGRLW